MLKIPIIPKDPHILMLKTSYIEGSKWMFYGRTFIYEIVEFENGSTSQKNALTNY